MMQPRDLGSELLVAIAAVAVLVFALIFGILLSLSSNPANVTATQTPLVVAVATETLASEARTTEPTQTTATVTSSALPATDVMAGDTHTSTMTMTATATETETPTATHTVTSPPSATVTPSRTTPPTATDTATIAPTVTLMPTETSGIRPTPTPTETPIVSATPAVCVRPPGWTTYVVQAGNTLFSIGLAVGSNVRELSAVNCLTDPDHITAGDVLFVPNAPVAPVQTGVAGGDFVPVGAIGCRAPQIATITNLAAGQRIRSAIRLHGTAHADDFWYYKLEVRPDAATEYNFYLRAEQPVVNGELGVLNPAIFGRGRHWVRLVVVALDASVTDDAVCVIPVIFE